MSEYYFAVGLDQALGSYPAGIFSKLDDNTYKRLSTATWLSDAPSPYTKLIKVSDMHTILLDDIISLAVKYRYQIVSSCMSNDTTLIVSYNYNITHTNRTIILDDNGLWDRRMTIKYPNYTIQKLEEMVTN